MVRKNYFVQQPATAFVSMTFGELRVGESFIGLPLPGDNGSNGGYRGVHYAYKKTLDAYSDSPNRVENCIRARDKKHYYFSRETEIIWIK